jgi:putative transcriptional regulator
LTWTLAQALPLPTYTAETIRQLREKLRVSQGVFAAYLNASLSTVQKWENGEKKPSGAALRLLSVIERRGLDVLV